jgi:signal transduction histidine kinase
MKKTLFFFMLIGFGSANAQKNNVIDSLQLALKKGTEKQKIITLINISDEYSNFDLDQAIFYANKSLIKAKKMQNDSLMGLSFNAIANNFQYKTELDSALKYHKKALNIRLKIKDSIGLADTYNNLGIFYDTKGEFSNAIKNYFNALYFYERKQKIAKQAMVCSNIGIVFKAQKEYKKAIVYYRKSYELYSKTEDNFGKTTSAGNLGSILINLKQYDESLKYSTIAKNGYEKLGYERFVGYPLSSIAYVYDSLHKFKIANSKYIESIKLHEKHQNNFEIAEVSGAFANCLIKQTNYAQSIELAKKSLYFSKMAKAYLLEINSYQSLAIANSKLGNYQDAYRFSKLYNFGKDSIFKTQNSKSIFELETKYQTAQKEKLILQQQAESKQKNIWLILISSIATIGLLLFRQQRLKSRQQKEQALLENELLQEQSNFKIQEQRLDISRELHDSVGSQLTFIISILDNLKNAPVKLENTFEKKIDNLSGYANNSISELRDTIWALNTDNLTISELETRILNFIKDASESVETIHFDFKNNSVTNFQLTSKQGINLFRVVQEAVNNAVKHSKSTEINIVLDEAENQLSMKIQDNGQGFNYEEKKKKSFGLTNLQNRTRELNGTFDLISNDAGTSINITIPISK